MPVQSPHSIDITVDVSWTGDLPHRYLDRPAPKIEKQERNQIAGVERPAFERHELEKGRVAARIWRKPQGPPGVGFVTNASVTGMWIETDSAMPARTQVQVELLVPGGYSATLSGKIVRANASGMAVQLKTEDSTWQFRSSFLELARREDGQAPSVIIRKGDVEEGERAPEIDPNAEAADFRVLGAKWQEVLTELSSDAVHQEFIQECLRRQRLEFGLERYRELKDGPDDAIAAKYLGQIGVILGFMSLKKEQKGDDGKRARMAKLILLFAVVVGALLLAKELFLTKATVTDPPPAAMAPRVDELPPPPPLEDPVEESSDWELPKKKKQ
jgi:hypothetical protein